MNTWFFFIWWALDSLLCPKFRNDEHIGLSFCFCASRWDICDGETETQTSCNGGFWSYGENREGISFCGRFLASNCQQSFGGFR